MRNKLYYPQVRSRHPSHKILRDKTLEKNPFKSVIRLGSKTPYIDVVSMGGNRIEINETSSIIRSANKLYMKNCFKQYGVKTADWFTVNVKLSEYTIHWQGDANCEPRDIEFPIVAKSLYGSRGEGNYYIDTLDTLDSWAIDKDLSNYIFEKFYSYSREYRLHVTKYGCFYTCRKMLKSDTPSDKRWFRNDSNSVWVLENNPAFDKPSNWDDIVNESIKALCAVGLDIGAIDVKVQSRKNKDGEIRDSPKFIILETNSAPSFGEITSKMYINELNKLLKLKKEDYENSKFKVGS